jgi:hypothetical protein
MLRENKSMGNMKMGDKIGADEEVSEFNLIPEKN